MSALRSSRKYAKYILPAAAGFAGFGFYHVFWVKHKNHPGRYDKQIYSSMEPIRNSQIPKRPTQLERLKSGEVFDVLVVGGGCSGAGIALDANARGLSVALVERDDFSSGTSSRSTKLIHGGVRYLEAAFKKLDYQQLSLVVDALNERRHLLSITPHLSFSIPLVVPLYHKFPEVMFFLPYYWIGMKLYDFFAGTQGTLRSSYFIGKEDLIEKFPMLNDRGLKGGIVYYDGIHNDARMNMAIALTAAAQGACVANHVEVSALIKDESGKICGATLRNLASDDPDDVWDVKCKVVVNATGPFCDLTRQLADENCEKVNKISSGIHIVLAGRYSPQRMGMLIPDTDDGRVVFLLPWEGSTVAGTTDQVADITDMPACTEKEVEFVVNEVARYLNTDLKFSDIDACWSGLRPLALDPESKDKKSQSLSRDHVIYVEPSGLVTITGGKWTTYRKMAADVVDRIIADHFSLLSEKPCRTTEIPLVGASGWSLSVTPALIRKGFSHEVSEHLSHNYGFNAFEVAEIALDGFSDRLAEGYPFIAAEVLYTTRYEYAVNTVDVIARRLRLAFLNSRASHEALPRVISLLGRENNWSTERRIAEYHQASKFLGSMNLHEEMTRHTWYERQPSVKLFNRVSALFTSSPFTVDEIRFLKRTFNSPEYTCANVQFSHCEHAPEIINKFLKKFPKFKQYESRMNEKVKDRERARISLEDFLFSLVSVVLSDN